MNFQNSINEGYIKLIPKDRIRTKGLIKSSEQTINFAKSLPINEFSKKTILRELYEGLRQYLEAIGYTKGYKFLSHKSITYFIKEILNKEKVAEIFDKYRKLRNGINYYGEDISTETVKKALKEISFSIENISKFL